MKMFGVGVAAAALVAAATFAAASAQAQSAQAQSAQGISDPSDAAHPARIEKRRGTRAYATAPSVARGRATAFDGSWSVLILTRSGACDPTFRYGVEISNGNVINAGGAQVALAGHVAGNGAIQVSVAAGDQQARGVGRLSTTTGRGTWRGEGSRGSCAGIWEAERRG